MDNELKFSTGCLGACAVMAMLLVLPIFWGWAGLAPGLVVTVVWIAMAVTKKSRPVPISAPSPEEPAPKGADPYASDNLGVYRDQGSGGSYRRPARATERRGRHDHDPGDPIIDGAELLRFEYVDFHGVATVREVSPWTEFDEYIVGQCLDAAAERTFRKDRIERWLDGTDRYLIVP